MIRSLFKVIYGTDPFEMKVDVDLPTAMARLRGEVKQSVFPLLSQPHLMGHIEDTKITLQYVIPFVSNGFKPILFAEAHSEEGGTFIRGYYRCHKFTQIFMSIWFGGLFFILCMAWGQAGQLEGFIMSGMLMLILATAIVKFGQWLSRHDKEKIERMMQEIMTDPSL